jgi:hypothetical protein
MDQEKLLYFKGLLEGMLHELLVEAGKHAPICAKTAMGISPTRQTEPRWNRTEISF